MRGLFNFYISAGLLTTALAAALFVRIGVLAFPLVGLTCGLAGQDFWRGMKGFFVSAALSLPLFMFLPMHRATLPALSDLGINYLLALLGAYAGAALQLPLHKLVHLAFKHTLLSLLALFLLAYILRLVYREQLRVLELWEYLTIIAAVPVLGLGIWLPVEIKARRIVASPEPQRQSPMMTKGAQ